MPETQSALEGASAWELESTGMPRRRRLVSLSRVIRIALLSFPLFLAQCGVLNPAFVNVIDSDGTLTTVDNAPGHIIVAFVNNAEVDERLLAFLESSEGGSLVLTDAEKRALRPRVRLRVRITFTDGTFQTVEFISGSSTLVDQRFISQASPDLNQNDLDNVVGLCEVASIQIEPGSSVDVFIPVKLTAFELQTATDANGAPVNTFQARQTIDPQFRVLQVDDLDEDGNVTLRRNIGVRDTPGFVPEPICGSVVAIVMEGVLSVPFLDGVSNEPSFDRDDPNTVASIGGRFEFSVAVQ